MKLNKLFAGVLAAAMMMSIGVSAMAETTTKKQNQDASFKKYYKIANAGTTNPEETFTFTFTAHDVTNTNSNMTTSQMPKIDDATVTYKAGTATSAGFEETVSVALDKVKWPDVGVYYYKVKETAGTTAGVTYDSAELNLKVTVAYDQGTDTYYTAFVTMSLADTNNDGITDIKSGGFTNEYSAGSLVVKKVVKGNLPDYSKKFDIDVTFEVEADKNGENPVKSTISYGENGSIAPSQWNEGTDGKFTASVEVQLNNNATATFTNIPYGVTYTVVEDAKHIGATGDGYTVDYTYKDDVEGKVTNTIDSVSETATVTNTKDVTIDTGVILDNAPYIVMLAVVAGGVVFMVSKKHREE